MSLASNRRSEPDVTDADRHVSAKTFPYEPRDHATPWMCPKCSTTTWTRNQYVIRCRICDHVWNLPKDEQ